MKKFITSIFILTLPFGVFAQENNTWHSALGSVSFATDSTWTVSGNGITQIWSDAVQTDYCSGKTEFRGFEWYNEYRSRYFRVDCRSNPYYKGDLFSWLAVSELKDELCPAPWRVPTRQDFVDLYNIILVGTINEWYLIFPYKKRNIWNSVGAGFSFPAGKLNQFGSAHYWSQSEIHTHIGFYFALENKYGESEDLLLMSNGESEDLLLMSNKAFGLSLRCVRNP